jgi:hypothetical protein
MKLMNNLSKDALLETYRSQSFNNYQLICIERGLSENIDVTIYAKPQYSFYTMDLIRVLLYANIDVRSCFMFDKLDVNTLIDLYKEHKHDSRVAYKSDEELERVWLSSHNHVSSAVLDVVASRFR